MSSVSMTLEIQHVPYTDGVGWKEASKQIQNKTNSLRSIESLVERLSDTAQEQVKNKTKQNRTTGVSYIIITAQ